MEAYSSGGSSNGHMHVPAPQAVICYDWRIAPRLGIIVTVIEVVPIQGNQYMELTEDNKPSSGTQK